MERDRGQQQDGHQELQPHGPTVQQQQQAEKADEKTLLRYEELFGRADFVLEPNCFDIMVQYITAGGKPEPAIECLSDNYMGYAHMGSLVCRWLKSLDEDSSGPASQHQQAQQQQQQQAFDEFYFLKELTKARFDPDKLSGVFTRGGGKPPPWLDGLISAHRGRQLIYELSAQHKNCLLLNFAIQKILVQGHEDEVASVGSSLAGYFSVFHRLLAARLRASVNACCSTDSSEASRQQQQHGASTSAPSRAAAALANLSRELVDTCSTSQHTYLHAQQMLKCLAGHAQGHIFQRLSQELEAATGAQHPAAWAMMKMFLPPGTPATVVEATHLVGRLLSASSSSSAQQLSSVDVVKLWQLYIRHDHPPLQCIQHPQLLQLLLAAVFVPGKPLPPEVQAACFGLLACATSALDSIEDDGVGARREATLQALQAALCLVSRAHCKLSEKDVETAYSVVAVPLVCLGMLHYMHCHLAQRDYYHEASSLASAPTYLRLSLLIAQQQPELCQQVADLLQVALVTQGSQRADLSRSFLDGLVLLMRDCHAVREVTAAVDAWSASVDPSLVRHLILQILSAMAPPYSPTFALWLLRAMCNSSMRRGRDAHRGSRTAELLQEFAAACSSITFPHPGLSAKEAAFLQELRTCK